MTDTLLTPNITLSQANELTVLRIANKNACASIAVQGAHIFEYTPTDQQNLLFVSEAETFETGQAIRGGIPICWPWFGAHATEANAPAHGFVRTTPWQYDIIEDTDTRTDIRFWQETDGTDIGFPHKARVELLVSVGETLIVSLTTQNQSDTPFLISQALHTYFKCDDINQVKVHGITGACYQDKLTQQNLYVPSDFNFNREIDWVVQDQGEPVGFTGVGKHAIKLTRMGSRSLVVWNPWIAKSKTLSHFHAQEYLKMFCVETANTSEDSRLVKPNENHVMMMELSATPIDETR
jgi:glucose-6-phosphate 1-epimerase